MDAAKIREAFLDALNAGMSIEEATATANALAIEPDSTPDATIEPTPGPTPEPNGDTDPKPASEPRPEPEHNPAPEPEPVPGAVPEPDPAPQRRRKAAGTAEA